VGLGRLREAADLHQALLRGERNGIWPLPEQGLAIGNMAKRPQTWQLFGVLRLD
jgi:hypothetical protein